MNHFLMLLAGCGHLDGSEIQETLCAMLALQKRGITLSFAALDKPQARTMNHRTREKTREVRHQLEESARLVRGNIKPLDSLHWDKYSGLVIPGGFGVASNFSTYAQDGAYMSVDPVVSDCILAFHKAAKPIGGICIAPLVIGKVLGSKGITLTLGDGNSQAAKDVETFGARHQSCAKGECVIDEEARIVSTPAFMHDDATLLEVSQGIEKWAQWMVQGKN